MLLKQLVKIKRDQKPSIFFVTGTDTGAGKTFLTCALVREAQAQGISAAGFKPICCGDRGDARKLWELTHRQIPLNIINPIWLPHPVAPVAQRSPSWETLLQQIQHALIQYKTFGIQLILIEGVGGFLCPITRKHTVRELAEKLGFPILLVARNQLGVLNHTLLTLEAIRLAKLKCRAILLNDIGKRKREDHSITTNRKVLSQLTRLPVYQV